MEHSNINPNTKNLTTNLCMKLMVTKINKNYENTRNILLNSQKCMKLILNCHKQKTFCWKNHIKYHAGASWWQPIIPILAYGSNKISCHTSASKKLHQQQKDTSYPLQYTLLAIAISSNKICHLVFLPFDAIPAVINTFPPSMAAAASNICYLLLFSNFVHKFILFMFNWIIIFSSNINIFKNQFAYDN